MDIVCNSRHKIVQEMLGYFNQGAQRRAALTEHGGVDPIWYLSTVGLEACTSS